MSTDQSISSHQNATQRHISVKADDLKEDHNYSIINNSKPTEQGTRQKSVQCGVKSNQINLAQPTVTIFPSTSGQASAEIKGDVVSPLSEEDLREVWKLSLQQHEMKMKENTAQQAEVTITDK